MRRVFTLAVLILAAAPAHAAGDPVAAMRDYLGDPGARLISGRTYRHPDGAEVTCAQVVLTNPAGQLEVRPYVITLAPGRPPHIHYGTDWQLSTFCR